MRKQTLARLGGLAIGAVALSAMIALAFAHMQGGSVSAQAEPEMTLQIGDCTADCEVFTGQPFTLSIVGSTLPAGGFRAFQTELFPGGLTYRPGVCANEVAMEPLGLCLGPVVLLPGQIGHGGLTALGTTPPASNSSSLVNMPLTCPGVGTHEVALTKYPSSRLGSRYKDVNGDSAEIRSVGTRSLGFVSDVDPDVIVTLEVEVGAVLTVRCVAPPAATATATPGPVVLPPTGASGSLGGEDGGSGLWLAAIVALAAGAAAVALAAIGWYYRSRRAA